MNIIRDGTRSGNDSCSYCDEKTYKQIQGPHRSCGMCGNEITFCEVHWDEFTIEIGKVMIEDIINEVESNGN